MTAKDKKQDKTTFNINISTSHIKYAYFLIQIIQLIVYLLLQQRENNMKHIVKLNNTVILFLQSI